MTPSPQTVEIKPHHTVLAIIAVLSLFLTILVAAISAENRFVHQEQYRFDIQQIRQDRAADMQEIREALRDIRADIRALDQKMEVKTHGQPKP